MKKLLLPLQISIVLTDCENWMQTSYSKKATLQINEQFVIATEKHSSIENSRILGIVVDKDIRMKDYLTSITSASQTR